MDYEKKLALAKEALDSGSYDKETIEYIFPELKESEDERIRKTLIDYFNTCHGDYYGELKRKDILAWLEKQGKQEQGSEFKADDWYVSKVDGKIHKIYHSVDKVEPKFKVGEWIVWRDKCYKVNYNGCGYELVDQDGLSTSLEYGTIDENAHLWDVTTDAKDGDVLHSSTHNLIWIYKDIQHYHACVNMNYVKENFSTDGFIVTPTDVCPATKDKQTILFAKMKEAGYEWDSEKKELRKIEPIDEYEGLTDFERTLADICIGWIGEEIGWKQYIKDNADVLLKIAVEKFNSVQDTPFEQKPTDNDIKEALRTEYEKGRADAIAEIQNHAWSEEDESYLNTTIAYLKDAKEFKKSAENCINWLKSLKDRVQPILRRRHTIFDEII